jgi:glyoxylase-like metal-dependent hydrolase (beta-lactamase superfamily II)
MKIRFLGAAGDVTGSAYHVITKDASILVDCGFFQGRKQESAKNRRTAQIEDGKLDAVVLTHGHLDHIGRLPLLTLLLGERNYCFIYLPARLRKKRCRRFRFTLIARWRSRRPTFIEQIMNCSIRKHCRWSSQVT